MKIGEGFIKAGLITREQLKIALEEQEKSEDRLGEIILRLGFLSQKQMAPFLANYFQIQHVSLSEIYRDIKPEVINIIPIDMAQRFQIISVDLKDNVLSIATFDPLNLLALDTVRLKTGHKIQCVLAAENEISEAIDYCYNNLPRLQEYINDYIDSEASVKMQTSEEVLQFAADDQPVVQYVRSIIVQAVSAHASDIHIKPKQNVAEIAFRVDGILYPIDPPPKSMLAAISTRIKIMAGLDIAEKRLPQDGRLKIKIGSREVDVRTSTFPTIYGESVVMRLLDTSSPLVGLQQLGLAPNDYKKFEDFIRRPYGLILVTGPTGSGKTTTLYAALNEIKSTDKNIITIEDPVEYRLPFIQQSQINPAIGFDFTKGLRSILRQDPDVIMVGEIRDRETAEISINAALTGHMVFSTLHTNDAAGAAVRMANMGVEPFLITSSLLCIVAQRLIRTICPDCKEVHPATKNMVEKLGLPVPIEKFYRGRGCPKCLNSGYRGRTGIYELLVPNNDICQMILRKCSSEELKSYAVSKGMKTLRHVAFDKLKEGITTPEEVLRVTQQTQESHG